MLPQLCEQWQLGECKKGENCRFDHPGNGLKQPNNNRFAALQNSSHTNSNISNRTGLNHGSTNQSYYSYKESIIHDLTVDRPHWPLSAYGLGRYSPSQLFGGFPREQSFEEMRLHHYLASSDPKKLQKAILDANNLAQEAEKQIQHAAQNIDEAVKYLIEVGQKHPNREDICMETKLGKPSTTSSETGSSFPSQMIPNKNQFNGNQSTSKFTPPFGNHTPPVFGTTSAPAGSFGQPSALGQYFNPFTLPTSKVESTVKPSGVFGKNFGSTATNNFVNPNTNSLGQTNNVIASNQPPNSGPFGNQNSFTSTPFQPFGGISSSSGNQDHRNAYPHSNIVNQSNPLINLVSTPSVVVSPFFSYKNISPSLNSSNQFGIINEASVTQSSGPPQSFGRPSILPNTSISNANIPPIYSENVFPHSSSSKHYNPKQISMPHSAMNSQYSTNSASPKSFKNKPVQYKNNIPGYITKDGSWERIWFLDGKSSLAGVKMPPEISYDEKTTGAYAYARKNKKFENGIIPTLPPKEEWCGFDF